MIEALADGTKIGLMNDYPRIYKWEEEYALLRFTDGAKVLIFSTDPNEASDTTPVVSHQGRVFDDLLRIHIE